MKKLFLLAIALAFLASFASCGNDDYESDYNIRPETPFDLYDGNWYLNGDYEGEYYQIEGNTYQKFTDVWSGEPYESGIFIIDDGASYRYDEHLTSGGLRLMKFTKDDGNAPGVDRVYVSDYNRTLYFMGDDFMLFYLRDSLMDTEDGDGLIVKYMFLYNYPCEYYGEGTRKVLQFIHSGKYRITEYADGKNNGEIIIAGDFDMSGDGIALYHDGDRFMAYFTNQGTSIWIEEFDEEYFFN